MSVKLRLVKNSSIYSIANVLQQMMAFFLLPLYTRFLTPNDYGIVSVVNSVSAFLVILLSISLHAAISRFYFDYKDNKQELKRFWGTIFTFLFVFVGIVSVLLIVFGRFMLQPILDDVAFYPYMLIGMVGVAFEPFYRSLGGMLIAMERSKVYGTMFLFRFLITTSAIIILITGYDAGAKGVLLANAGASVLFFTVGIFVMRKHVAWFSFKFSYLKEALKYSLPLVPHHLSATVKGTTDKLFLNGMLSTSAAGLYNIAFRFGSLISVLYTSVNLAFYPIFMNAMKSEDENELDELKRIGLFLVFSYVFSAVIISLFAREIIIVFTTSDYYSSFRIVPILAFGSVASGIYVIIVNSLFYFKERLKFISIITIASALLNVPLNYILIMHIEIVGAAWATLATNIFTVILIAIYQNKFTKIKWNFFRFTAIYIIGICVSMFMNYEFVLNQFSSTLVFVSIKLGLLLLVFVLMNKLCWGQWFYLIYYGRKIVTKILGK